MVLKDLGASAQNPKTLQRPTATGACDCRLEAVLVCIEGVWLERIRDMVGIPSTICCC